jgi:ABC-2 type transport system permease protein
MWNKVSWLRFWTVLRRELTRFWGIKRQTILGPLLETYLYISVFGAALGSRINELEGHPYIVFILPGLIMMTFAMNTFSNNSSSLLQQKIQRAIDDQLASPVSNTQLLLAFAAGGLIRGTLIASITYATALLLVDDLPLVHPGMLLLSFLLIGSFFAMLGILVGLRSEKFDDMSFYQTFVLQPLIFLGGVFYSAILLPEPFATLTRLDPIYYMINTVRYSMLGHADVNPALSLSVIAIAAGLLFALNYRLFQRGYKLRA